jgi:D-alanyl-lipoteichoic acid acyltransferase DltB (MBOAT superfamily)
MEFNSTEFLAFLSITLLVFYSIKAKYRWIILLISSLIFIYSFSLHFLIFTLAFAIFNYLIAIAISKCKEGTLKTLWYQIGVWMNIGLLIFYKYANFLIDNIFSLFGKTIDNHGTPLLELIVPIGISFYTFQSIGYLIDVKRGTKPAEINPGKFILFIMYFPKFISGPVERSGNLLPQINKELDWNGTLFYEGLLQMLWGFFKTIVISDRLSVFVNSVTGDIYGSSSMVLLINFFIQFLYLYINFSGYTDIVLGISKLFGISLINNFNRPLFAVNVSDYWRRWHISLTSWCNDYIFRRVILKRIKWRQWASVYAVFITFLIIGIWHGASWNFVILGLLQGIAINYEFFTKKARLNVGRKLPIWLNTSLSRLFTIIFICISHVFFFTKNIHDALYYFSSMFRGSANSVTTSSFGYTVKDIIIVSLGILIIFLSEYRDETGKKSIKAVIVNNKYLFWIVVAGTIVMLIITGVNKSSGFIYEQF